MLLPFIELEKFGEEMGCWGEQESRFLFWGDFWSRWSIGRHASPINSLCLVEFFVCDHQEPGYLCQLVTGVGPGPQLGACERQMIDVPNKKINQ